MLELRPKTCSWTYQQIWCLFPPKYHWFMASNALNWTLSLRSHLTKSVVFMSSHFVHVIVISNHSDNLNLFQSKVCKECDNFRNCQNIMIFTIALKTSDSVVVWFEICIVASSRTQSEQSKRLLCVCVCLWVLLLKSEHQKIVVKS